ncbi:hypothetical protein JB92DRAFT_3122064 [Gautieria morchelliformis]|nr:hypothetical protein JB92DRAFT_3122064 [Gautieria morchelliformis]
MLLQCLRVRQAWGFNFSGHRDAPDAEEAQDKAGAISSDGRLVVADSLDTILHLCDVQSRQLIPLSRVAQGQRIQHRVHAQGQRRLPTPAGPGLGSGLGLEFDGPKPFQAEPKPGRHYRRTHCSHQNPPSGPPSFSGEPQVCWSLPDDSSGAQVDHMNMEATPVAGPSNDSQLMQPLLLPQTATPSYPPIPSNSDTSVHIHALIDPSLL